MTVSTQDIKALRERTEVSVIKCKEALEEAGGDMEKAVAILKQKNKGVAQKKQDRTLGAGLIDSYIHSNGAVGVLLELACETDFVAKNPEFQELAHLIALHIAAMSPIYVCDNQIPETERESVKAMLAEELQDKPAEVRDKALTGKLESHFQELTLLKQSYVKDPEQTVGNLIESAIEKFGERIEIIRFTRFEVGKE